MPRKTVKETELVGFNARPAGISIGNYHNAAIRKRMGSKRTFEIQAQVCQAQ